MLVLPRRPSPRTHFGNMFNTITTKTSNPQKTQSNKLQKSFKGACVCVHAGVFIAGGIVPRLMERVKTGVLLDAFVNKTARERFQYLLRNMPLYVVTNTKVGIIGSREYAMRLVRETEWEEVTQSQ